MDTTFAVLGALLGTVQDLAHLDVTVGSVLLAAALVAVPAGHVDRWVERKRFRVTMWRHGYSRHREYVRGSEWKDRRRRYLREHDPAECRLCARSWEPKWPLHHKSYERAGGGQELDRDLIPVCERCHSFIHSLDHKRGPLRRLGFSLRLTTWLAIGLWLPVRLARRTASPSAPTGQGER
ncbi:hypothetical protein CcI49_03175 [Frankia sp. CcI49]|uniref:hypothetical protein n=1 Tax=Frankia sp. CcI49 TaxID=1745382 RepID=UPI00097862D0|nr:hypothetical protein [Frankia sp. CcI49]ONH62395.1 hypothetical protein CcI49_03175 [Frankia sp. CcI49]